jgi:hypothetical protein
MKFKENDRVRTLVEKEGYPVGTIGVLVSVYADGKAGEVEVWDKTSYPMDVVTYEFSELSIVPTKEE